MKTSLQHTWHWMHDEGAAAGHWCSQHMLHDARFWLYLLIAGALAALIALLFSAGGGAVLDYDPRFFVYPYGAL
jgi:hypothetical protein